MASLSYILAAGLFILGVKMLGRPSTARRGNLLSALGMLLALVATLFHRDILSFQGIVVGLAIGTAIGVAAARWVAMTAMPEMVALFNGLGGLASFLIGWEAMISHPPPPAPGLGLFQSTTLLLSVTIGAVTFTGSLVAWAKLKEVIPGRPLLFPGQKAINILILVAILGCAGLFATHSLGPLWGERFFYILMGLAFLLGLLFVLPIGGADMPVVISLLNSYSGLAASAAGFVIGNHLLIVAGALVGASGIILTHIMCKGMNRSLGNVLFSGFGSGFEANSQKGGKAGSKAGGEMGDVKTMGGRDCYYVLEAAQSVVVVPGYGLAVAQAQHAVRELQEILEGNGADVRFAIHPVAGRMPGHMNVLLAEANVPYDLLVEMDDINPTMDTVDVCLVIGANDVVNPAAQEDQSSPIYGMPIIEVHRAKTVVVFKRSMGTGFAGIQNPLFFKDNTRMVFGDAKVSLIELAAEFKS